MWFVIFLVAIAIFYLAIVIRKKGSNEDSTMGDRPSKLEGFEKEAAYWKEHALKQNIQALDFKLEHEKLNAMETDYLRLRERFRHDNQKVKQIIEDWYDYCRSIYEIKVARELLDVSNSDNAYDEFDERTKEYFIKVQEIEKRVEKELGKEAHITYVNKQYIKQEK